MCEGVQVWVTRAHAGTDNVFCLGEPEFKAGWEGRGLQGDKAGGQLSLIYEEGSLVKEVRCCEQCDWGYGVLKAVLGVGVARRDTGWWSAPGWGWL